MHNNLLDRTTTGAAGLGVFAWPTWWPTLEATSSWAAYMVPIVSLILLTVQLVRWIMSMMREADAPK